MGQRWRDAGSFLAGWNARQIHKLQIQKTPLRVFIVLEVLIAGVTIKSSLQLTKR
jgi:hypothetical protein